MVYIIEEKVPYIIMGGVPISNTSSTFEEKEFFQKIKDEIGEENFEKNEAKIREHLKIADSYIEFGNFIFRCR